jgi:hypothetical protein
MAIERNCGRMQKEIGREVAAAIHGCVYLPTYAVYTGYRAGKNYSPDLPLNLHLDAG